MIFSRSVHPIMPQWRTTVLPGGERGCLVRGCSRRPASNEDTHPCERQGPDGSLRGRALLALLLGVPPCPASMADGCRGPFDARVSQAGGTLPAPRDPRCVPAAFRSWRDPRVLVACRRGGGAFPLFPAGDEAAGSQDGAWQRGKASASGMARGTLGHGLVACCHGWEAHTERSTEGLHEAGMGEDPPCIGRQRWGVLEGLEARGDEGTVAPVLGVEEARQGRAACALGGLERRPWGEHVAEPEGVLGLNPWQDVWQGVVQGTRATRRDASCGAAHPAAMGDEWRQSPPGWALGVQGLQGVTRREQACQWACGVRGVVLGMTGRAGCTGRGQGPRVEGTQDEEGVVT